MKWRDFITAALVELLKKEQTVSLDALCDYMQLHWTRLCGDIFKPFPSWESYIKKVLHNKRNRDFVLHHNGRYSLRASKNGHYSLRASKNTAESDSECAGGEKLPSCGAKRKCWESPQSSRQTNPDSSKRRKPDSAPDANAPSVVHLGSASVTTTLPLAKRTLAPKEALFADRTPASAVVDKDMHLIEREATARTKAEEARLFEARLQRVEARLEDNYTTLTSPNLWAGLGCEAPLYVDLCGHLPITEALMQHQVYNSHNAQLHRARWERSAYSNYLATIGFYSSYSPLRHKYMQFRKAYRFTKETEERLLQRVERL